jgi:branched-chain amino acid aminotransferase
MINEMIEKYYILNGSLLPVEEIQKEITGGSKSIYEVIRVISGVPLFLEKHMDRLEASANLIDYSLEKAASKINADIHKLIEANGKPEKNIKIVVYNLENSEINYRIFFIKSSYPKPQDYENGIHTILYQAERENPNAKIINQGFKEAVAAELEKSHAYEALLVNENREITEGSRSNVFFVKKDTVYTSPKGSVLIGITRSSVFELCSSLSVEIIEKPISTAFLEGIDGLFITGTSPKLLPVKSIGNTSYDSSHNPVIRKLMEAYDEMIEKYILAAKDRS